MELIAKILDRQNIEKALKKVVSNKGTKGVDGLTVNDLKTYMETNWERIKQERSFHERINRIASRGKLSATIGTWRRNIQSQRWNTTFRHSNGHRPLNLGKLFSKY